MKAALIGVVTVGAGIGFLLPNGSGAPAETASAPPAVAEAATPPRASTTPTAPAVASSGWGGETRLKRGESGHFFAEALVNGRPVNFVVDTGATTVALTIEDARRIGIAFDPSRFEVIGSGASGAVRGQEVTLQTVSLDGKEVRSLRGAVLDGLDVSLLGQSFLSRVGTVTMTGDEMILR